MLPVSRVAEQDDQKSKLVNSYNSLLDEFASKDLHTVGNYQLGRLIGKGSFGKVYLASNKLVRGSKVVLKSANKKDNNLAREVHIHRQLIHPHIARLYEVVVTEEHVWLALEYCPGNELYNYLIEHGALEPSVVQKIFAQVIGAVSYVHTKSYVHRDLKLENILLDKNQNAKLVDFGFTREYQGKANYLQTFCGTVCYAAPEMLKGEKYAAEKVDVWSLGVILFALLSGELPFDEDDETATKAKILKEEPKYPASMPPQAKELINLCLSKRPLLRPSLADILAHPWLAEHAPHQQAILMIQQPAPFATQLETDCLQRMRNTGIDIDKVIENVLSQRCDGLAGWWALLLEKEDRKARRRDAKRREREIEGKAMRRVSAASARLERIAPTPTIRESDEESTALQGPRKYTPGDRGRALSNRSATSGTRLEDVSETAPTQPSLSATPNAPQLYERSPHRAVSNVRRRSQLGGRPDPRRRSSHLQLVATNAELLENIPKKKRTRYPQPFMNQIESIKRWFYFSAKRKKANASRANAAASSSKTPQDSLQNPLAGPGGSGTTAQGRPDLRRISSDILSTAYHQRTTALPETAHDQAGTNTAPGAPTTSNSRPDLTARASYPPRPRVSTNMSANSITRHSHSPSPLTPSSSYRRSKAAAAATATAASGVRDSSAGGLRSRKSTSSSISSIHTLHQPTHAHTHSMASSNSSTSLASPSLSVKSQTLTSAAAASGTPTTSKHHHHRRRSSPSSIAPSPRIGTSKALPSTPTAPLRTLKTTPPPLSLGFQNGGLASNSTATGPAAAGMSAAHSASFAPLNPPSPGLPIFAKRRRSPFRGPTLLNSGTALGAMAGGPGNNAAATSIAQRRRSDGMGLGRSGSVASRRSAGMIMEEEEEEDLEDLDDGGVGYNDLDYASGVDVWRRGRRSRLVSSAVTSSVGGSEMGDDGVEEVEHFAPLGEGEVVVSEGEGEYEDNDGAEGRRSVEEGTLKRLEGVRNEDGLVSEKASGATKKVEGHEDPDASTSADASAAAVK